MYSQSGSQDCQTLGNDLSNSSEVISTAGHEGAHPSVRPYAEPPHGVGEPGR